MRLIAKIRLFPAGLPWQKESPSISASQTSNHFNSFAANGIPEVLFVDAFNNGGDE
jgi:hypothetical protein